MTPDAESVSWLRIFLSFGIVFGLIGVLGFTLKYVGMRGIRMPGMGARALRRIDIVENLPLDTRRRLVIIRCDNNEHLLLLGVNQDIVIAPNLKKNQKTPPDTKKTP